MYIRGRRIVSCKEFTLTRRKSYLRAPLISLAVDIGGGAFIRGWLLFEGGVDWLGKTCIAGWMGVSGNLLQVIICQILLLQWYYNNYEEQGIIDAVNKMCKYT